jgi:hypothetical protein
MDLQTQYVDFLSTLKLTDFLEEMESFSLNLMDMTEQTEREGIAVELYDLLKEFRNSRYKYLSDNGYLEVIEY